MSMSALPERSDTSAQLERLSALMDGELDAVEVSAACSAWRSSAVAQTHWQLGHLVGDVLRSEDLAVEPARDRAFLEQLRTRLADEPVVLAPEPILAAAPPLVAQQHPGTLLRPVARRVWRRWTGPVGIAAGVVMVAGVVLTLRHDNTYELTGLSSPLLATQALPASGSQTAKTDVSARQDATADAALANYLRTHREQSGATSVAPAAGYLRNAAYEADR